MKFDHQHCVPCIRWKQGEYIAMRRLSDKTKSFITPLIEVPEIGFDFETNTLNKSIDKHLSSLAGRVKKNWQDRTCFIDLNLIDESQLMEDGRHPVKFVFDDLRAQKCLAIPVTGIARNPRYQAAVRQIVSIDKRGVCLRVSIEESAHPNLKTDIDTIIAGVNLNISECDLVIDLDAPNYNPMEGFSILLTRIIKGLPYLSRWRTFSIIGSSFPQTMAEVNHGMSKIPRDAWLFYRKLIIKLKEANLRLPTFGDYGINHPDILQLDMRKVKPSATIRYTVDDAWLIVKGPNVRDNGFEQYHDLCRDLIRSKYFLGAHFSAGDEYIAKCANGEVATGNLSTWRMVGTNHHLEKMVYDIANFYAS
jgi:hypothetical protein